jgi:hypothetical protein
VVVVSYKVWEDFVDYLPEPVVGHILGIELTKLMMGGVIACHTCERYKFGRIEALMSGLGCLWRGHI